MAAPLGLGAGGGTSPPPNTACLLSHLHLASSPNGRDLKSVSQGLSGSWTPDDSPPGPLKGSTTCSSDELPTAPLTPGLWGHLSTHHILSQVSGPEGHRVCPAHLQGPQLSTLPALPKVIGVLESFQQVPKPCSFMTYPCARVHI